MIHSFKAMAAVMVLGALATSARANDNIGDVRRSIESRGGMVSWGKHIDHLEYAKAAAAIASGNGGAYLIDLAKDIAKTTGKQVGLDVLSRLAKGETINLNGMVIQAGIVSYNHWQVVKYGEPRTRKVTWKGPFGIKTDGFEMYIEQVTKVIPLPNTHQFYIRIKK